jgi:hypothetical protein
VTAAADETGPRSENQAVAVNHEEELHLEAYTAYNTQDVDSLLALVSDEVDWPDGSSRLREAAAGAGVLDGPMDPHVYPRPPNRALTSSAWTSRMPDPAAVASALLITTARRPLRMRRRHEYNDRALPDQI